MPTSLPAATDFTGATVTEGDFKTAITNLRAYLAELFGTDGTVATGLGTLGALGSDTQSKTGAYTVVAADRGDIFLCDGTFDLSLTAAATLGDGFAFGVVNVGSGTITINPDGTEQIDGATTTTLTASQSCLVVCTGTAFRTIGKTPTVESNGRLVATTAYTSGTAATHTVNAATRSMIIELVGGGGGGVAGTKLGTQRGGGGGGSGAYIRHRYTSLTGVETYSYTVGAASTAGGSGNATSFGAFTAGGGSAGSNAAGGNGGTVTAGSPNIASISGGDGHPGDYVSTISCGGSGGGSFYGGAGKGGAGSASGAAGKANTGSGGGGGGADSAGGAGGASTGAAGLIIIHEFS